MRIAVIGLFSFSCLINLLALTGPMFMLEVYDRVLPSRSIPTLIALVLLMIGLFAVYGLLEIVRSRIMARVAVLFDTNTSDKVFMAIVESPMRMKSHGNGLRPSTELDQIRNFLCSPSLPAFFDLPWVPIYLAVCFILHPYVGLLALGAIAILLVFVCATDVLSKRSSKCISRSIAVRDEIAEASFHASEAMTAMGIGCRAAELWKSAHYKAGTQQRRFNDLSAMMSGFTKSFRNIVQSGTLALGAYLVIQGEMSAGTIIAASVIVSRALAPIDQSLPNWRNLVSAHQAWKRLKTVLEIFHDDEVRTELPRPAKNLDVSGLCVCPPGTAAPAIQNVSFHAEAGAVIGVIGPSGSGKSTLVRSIAGLWPAARGEVRLDGARLNQWSAFRRGEFIGYMSQSSALFPATVAQNIARLDPEADDEMIIKAAKSAGVHDLIVSLPQGYETILGKSGISLSSGQQQRLALARALYGNPFLVVLDEPNSNLDAAGDEALAVALAEVKKQGGIAIVVSHRNSVLSQIDYLLVMDSGTATAFGKRDTILSALQSGKLAIGRSSVARTLSVVSNEKTSA